MAKLKTEELEVLTNIQNQIRQQTQALGSMTYEQRLIEANIESISNSIQELQAQREAKLTELRTEYGDGTVDLTTGEFFPTEPQE